MGERIVVAMSGGVDSSVAALLLREAGCDVVGLFLKNGVTAEAHGARRPGHQGCCSVEDAQDARRVADALGIDFYALDYGAEFERLIAGFVDDYASGRTPSPCVLCNRWLKFGSLVGFARKIGASAVATGHYARVDEGPAGGGPRRLLRAADRAKDQSYFLAGLAPEQLAWCRFPVGGMTKPEVRDRARAAGLRTAEKPESMEICFVPGGDYRALISERAPGAMREGAIVDEAGREVGRHEGHAAFTIGQRRGIGVSSTAPRYVTAIDPRRNLVVIGGRSSLAKEALTADRFVWTSRERPAPGEEVACAAQIRHRHAGAPARARALEDGRVHVRFESPVDAVAPGQAVALYEGDVVLGGGFIAPA